MKLSRSQLHRLIKEYAADTDKDGTPDYRDTDSDNDGISDTEEKGDAPTQAKVTPVSEPRGCPTGDDMIQGILLAQKTSEVWDDRDRAKAIAHEHGMETITDLGLGIATALITMANPIAGVITGIGLPLAVAAFRGVKDIHKSLTNQPHDVVKGIEAFVDIINIAQEFQDVFSEKALRKIDDDYIDYLVLHANTCLKDMHNINQFIQWEYQLCKGTVPPQAGEYEDASPYAMKVGAASIDVSKPKKKRGWKDIFLKEDRDDMGLIMESWRAFLNESGDTGL